MNKIVPPSLKTPSKAKLPRKNKNVPSSTAHKLMPTLGTIQLLLHLYVTGEDWEISSRSSQAEKNAYTFLRNQNMVDADNSVTQKGEVWIDALRKIPLPLPLEIYRVPTYKLYDGPDAV